LRIFILNCSCADNSMGLSELAISGYWLLLEGGGEIGAKKRRNVTGYPVTSAGVQKR
jgi:hypothetical protein